MKEILAICLIFFGIFCCFAPIILSPYQEISASRYDNLIGVPARYIEPYMNDDKIVYWEYNKIIKEYSKDQIKEAL